MVDELTRRVISRQRALDAAELDYQRWRRARLRAEHRALLADSRALAAATARALNDSDAYWQLMDRQTPLYRRFLYGVGTQVAILVYERPSPADPLYAIRYYLWSDGALGDSEGNLLRWGPAGTDKFEKRARPILEVIRGNLLRLWPS